MLSIAREIRSFTESGFEFSFYCNIPTSTSLNLTLTMFCQQNILFCLKFLQMSRIPPIVLKTKTDVKVLKRPQRPRKSDEDRQKAIDEVRRGAGIRATARKYEMGVSTLHDAVYKGRKNSAGRDPYLTRPVEDRVVQWLGTMAQIGYGQSKRDVIAKVTDLVTELGLPMPWVENKPSSKWYQLFRQRHPEIHDRMSLALSREQAAITNDDLQGWFAELRQYMTTAGHPYIFDDPTRIYNADETGFSLSPRPPKVLADVTQRHVYQSGYASSKMQITVMLAASPVSHYIRPMVVYAGVQPRNEAS